ncbi:MAG: hypothetical protein H7Y01_05825 [Ferruginibacter sp.]|nr:hypothetical protein [Chitinophagaceae bacterium]
MKRILLLVSLALMISWVAGFFFIRSSPVMHILLFGSILLYIRSLLVVETRVNNQPGNLA